MRRGPKRKPLKRLQVSDLIAPAGLTRQRRRVTTQIRRLAWGFAIAFARNQVAWPPGLLLESVSLVRLTVVNGDATRPWLTRGFAADY